MNLYKITCIGPKRILSSEQHIAYVVADNPSEAETRAIYAIEARDGPDAYYVRDINFIASEKKPPNDILLAIADADKPTAFSK